MWEVVRGYRGVREIQPCLWLFFLWRDSPFIISAFSPLAISVTSNNWNGITLLRALCIIAPLQARSHRGDLEYCSLSYGSGPLSKGRFPMWGIQFASLGSTHAPQGAAFWLQASTSLALLCFWGRALLLGLFCDCKPDHTWNHTWDQQHLLPSRSI